MAFMLVTHAHCPTNRLSRRLKVADESDDPPGHIAIASSWVNSPNLRRAVLKSHNKTTQVHKQNRKSETKGNSFERKVIQPRVSRRGGQTNLKRILAGRVEVTPTTTSTDRPRSTILPGIRYFSCNQDNRVLVNAWVTGQIAGITYDFPCRYEQDYLDFDTVSYG